jgi:predicted glycogen debranching enzyme
VGIGHPVDASRGQVASGDGYSPGWFDLPLPKGAQATVVACADAEDPDADTVAETLTGRTRSRQADLARAGLAEDDAFGRALVVAAQAYVARRGEGTTVIAGYPWFLDWGRDTFICARGLLAAGLDAEVRQILATFGRFEADGTLPNCLNGDDASNRDTSDAPLWYGLACEEAAARAGDVYRTEVQGGGRTIADVLHAIAVGYLRGTPNGIRVDPASGLVWSPRHFTWMDTDFPAATPREGYPVEIQALWIRLLRQLEAMQTPAPDEPWGNLANRAQASFDRLFWLEERGWFADLLIAPQDVPADGAVRDQALRSNAILALSLLPIGGERARRCVEAAARHLVVPGALRSLAPLPATPPLPVFGPDGKLLNNPDAPYWGRYEGDEDTRRKPAYHNGTAWTWTFPAFCEALARAWDFSPAAVAAARAYLGSMDRLMSEGCLGQIPELTDGDAPHQQRGCDAQAWGVTEALRVWKLLGEKARTTGR